MLITEYKINFLNKLKEDYPPEEANSFFNILIKSYMGWERIDLALDPSKNISPSEVKKLDKALHRLLNHEPVQYITGDTEFFGLTFKVNKNVLIPRPETEELVDWIKKDMVSQQTKSPRILDIGTGSGCIAIALAKNFPQSRVFALDISEEALKVAGENAKHNEIQVKFIQANVLQLESLQEKFDVIVSNPPYVRELEKKEMERNVLAHEPSLALYVKDNDPLIFYKKITKLAKEGLNPSGRLYFEINRAMGPQTIEVLEEEGFEAELREDIFGNQRMIRGIIRT